MLHLGKVLVVEDDETTTTQIRSTLGNFITDSIFAVSNAADAIKHIDAYPDSFDLIISSVKMRNTHPGAVIQHVHAHANRRVRETPILALVGVVSKFEISLLIEHDCHLIVRKPFSNELLAEKVSEIMGAIEHQSGKYAITAKAKDLIRNHKLQEALDFLKAQITAGLSSLKILSLLGKVYFELGQFEAAEAVCNGMIKTSPEYLPALNLKAKLLVHNQKYDEALCVMEDCQVLSPLNVQRLIAMAKIQQSYGRSSLAEEKFRRALTLHPDAIHAKTGLIRTLIELGRCKEAQAMIAKLDDPEEVASELNWRGIVLVKAGKVTEGIDFYNKALKALGEDFNQPEKLYFNIALAHLKISEQDLAESFLNKALSLNPKYQKAQNLLLSLSNGTHISQTSESLQLETSMMDDKKVDFVLGKRYAVSASAKGGVDASDSSCLNEESSIDRSGKKITILSYAKPKGKRSQVVVSSSQSAE